MNKYLVSIKQADITVYYLIEAVDKSEVMSIINEYPLYGTSLDSITIKQLDADTDKYVVWFLFSLKEKE